MRISDWSSDVCSSDLRSGRDSLARFSTSCPDAVDSDTSYRFESHEAVVAMLRWPQDTSRRLPEGADRRRPPSPDRKSVVSGKSVSVRVDLGGRRVIKKKKTEKSEHNI